MSVYRSEESDPAGEPIPQPPQPVATPQSPPGGVGESLNLESYPDLHDDSSTRPGVAAVLKGLWRGMNNLLDDLVVVLGSENVYLASREQPQPTSYAAYVAVSKVNGKVIAMGDKARALMGREPQNIEVARLLTHGIPDNPAMFGDFLQRIVKRHFHNNPFLRPRVLVTGNFCTPLMKQVCTEGLFRIKTRDIMFCEPEIAAAVGMGLDILKPDLQSVMVIEKDWMGFMVMSMSGSLTRVRMNTGFHDLLEDVLIYFEESNNFTPRADDLAEQFLTEGFTGTPNLIGWEAWVDQVGRGKTVSLEASPEHFQKAVTPTLLRIRHSVNQSLQALSREQVHTVQSSPTYLAGEYADLPGFRELLEAVFGRKFVMPENPHHAMARGMVNLVPNIEMLKAINGGAEAGGIEI